MSIPGEWKAATIAKDASSSAAVDLGRDWDLLEVQIPTLDDPTTLKLQTAELLAGDYHDLGDSVTTAAGTHHYNDVWELGGWQYIKVVADNNQGSERLIRVRGWAY